MLFPLPNENVQDLRYDLQPYAKMQCNLEPIQCEVNQTISTNIYMYQMYIHMDKSNAIILFLYIRRLQETDLDVEHLRLLNNFYCYC